MIASDPVPRRIALIAGLLYGAFYLWIIGDLDIARRPAWSAQFAPLDLSAWLQTRGLFLFEAIGMLQANFLLFLVSPLNILIAASLATLLAANIHGAVSLHRTPGQCRGSNGGVLGGALPAMLAGSACCAPGILLLLGMPALGAFSALFGYLIPLSMVLLAGNRLWQLRQGAPRLFRPHRQQDLLLQQGALRPGGRH